MEAPEQSSSLSHLVTSGYPSCSLLKSTASSKVMEIFLKRMWGPVCYLKLLE